MSASALHWKPTERVGSPTRRQGLRIYGLRWRRRERLRIQPSRQAIGEIRPTPPEAARIHCAPPSRTCRFIRIAGATISVARTSVTVSGCCCTIASGGRVTSASISPPGHSAITPISDRLRLIDP
jgi:hypothetical protein